MVLSMTADQVNTEMAAKDWKGTPLTTHPLVPNVIYLRKFFSFAFYIMRIPPPPLKSVKERITISYHIQFCNFASIVLNLGRLA